MRHGSLLEVFLVATKLGLTSFGGPVAHIGYFHEEYVRRRRWIDDRSYADLVALCQFLPGPASSKVGMALGTIRAGLLGGVAAWLGFTLPSALALVAFAYGVGATGAAATVGWLHGLKVVAVAVVALAVWNMARTLCPDRERVTLAIAAAVVAGTWPSALGQILPIAAAGIIGLLRFRAVAAAPASPVPVPVGARAGAIAWGILAALLAALPLLRRLTGAPALAVFDGFFRVGALVFGGGHVVLPLLHAEVVAPGWISNERFVAGYGAAQAVPGPLFTFAAYLGFAMQREPGGWLGAAIALVAIFAPAYLMTVGALPFWSALRARAAFQAALRGINAAVVGLLLAALYRPVWTSAILAPADFALGLVAFGLLALWKWPAWLVVALSALGAQLLSRA